MKPLLLGLGLQGKATLHDLETMAGAASVVVADLDAGAAAAWLAGRGHHRARAVPLDATDEAALLALMRGSGADIVINMLPAPLQPRIAAAAIAAGLAYVSTSYAGPLAALDAEARARGVTVLPEMGFDPGIDLILARKAVDELDEVEGLNSYGAGVPERAACDNPLDYKISWTFAGVLNAYRRDARLLADGQPCVVPGDRLFRPEHVRLVPIPGLGPMEAYPNGDALAFRQALGLGAGLKTMGRYAMRWPGHCAFWLKLVELGFLDDAPAEAGEGAVSPRQFLINHLTPRLQYRADERDLAILRVEAWGRKDGRAHRVVYDLIDARDLATGFFAMNRTVGYTASIAAQLVASGAVTGAGVLSPARDVPADAVLAALTRRGIQIVRRDPAALAGHQGAGHQGVGHQGVGHQGVGHQGEAG